MFLDVTGVIRFDTIFAFSETKTYLYHPFPPQKMVKSRIFDNSRLLTEHPEIPHYRDEIVCFASRYEDRSYPADECYFNRELYLILIQEGRSEIRLNGSPVMLEAHTLLLHGPHYLTDHLYSSPDIRFITLAIGESLRTDNAYLAQTTTLLLELMQHNGQFTIPLTPSESHTLQQELASLTALLGTEHRFLRQRIQTACLALFLDIADFLSHKHIITRRPTHREHLLTEFHTLATRHFRHHHHIRFYADRLAVSEQYLSRIVRSGTGKSVGRILADLLTMEASTLLGTTKESVGEIALRLGFSDTPGFCKFFRRQTGLTPLGFRKRTHL